MSSLTLFSQSLFVSTVFEKDSNENIALTLTIDAPVFN
jgi:hypothetical protein